jgi:hypothetical protein
MAQIKAQLRVAARSRRMSVFMAGCPTGSVARSRLMSPLCIATAVAGASGPLSNALTEPKQPAYVRDSRLAMQVRLHQRPNVSQMYLVSPGGRPMERSCA